MPIGNVKNITAYSNVLANALEGLSKPTTARFSRHLIHIHTTFDRVDSRNQATLNRPSTTTDQQILQQNKTELHPKI
jgi:hypothetical protein